MPEKISKSERLKNKSNRSIRTTDIAGILFTIIAIILIIYGVSNDSAFLVVLGFFAFTSAIYVISAQDRSPQTGKEAKIFIGGNVDLSKPESPDSSLIQKEIREAFEKAKEEILRASAGKSEPSSDRESQAISRDALEKEIWAARQKVSERGKEISSWHASAIEYIDFLDRTIGLDGLDESYRKSCMQARSEFLKTMEKMGITEINPDIGEIFDDRRHIAEGVKSADGLTHGVISGVEQVGFTVGSKVLRPARVWLTPESEGEITN
jgi:molecular chaperone GrpE (heat shock protein)